METPAHGVGVVSGRLTMDDFILEMMRIPVKDLKLDQLKELFGHLDLQNKLIEEHIHFSKDCYTRNLVCRTPRFDMLVLCWRPGHVTTIHDHAGSLNVTRVYGGSLTSRLFAAAERPSPGKVIVREACVQTQGKNDLSCVDFGQIHQLENTSGHDLVTVHVYARPLRDIVVYCPTSGEVTRVGLRYTLEDDFS